MDIINDQNRNHFGGGTHASGKTDWSGVSREREERKQRQVHIILLRNFAIKGRIKVESRHEGTLNVFGK